MYTCTCTYYYLHSKVGNSIFLDVPVSSACCMNTVTNTNIANVHVHCTCTRIIMYTCTCTIYNVHVHITSCIVRLAIQFS